MIGDDMTGSQKSEFNMAVSWLNRLNYWFYVCDEHSYNLEGHEWLQTLMILFRELATEIKADDKKIYQEKARSLFDKLHMNSKQIMRTGKKGISPDIYWELHDFEEFLRKSMDKSGLLKKVMEDAAKALR